MHPGPFAQMTKAAFDDMKEKAKQSAMLQDAIDEEGSDDNALTAGGAEEGDGVGEGIDGGWEEVEAGGALQATASPSSPTGDLPPVKPPPGSGGN